MARAAVLRVCIEPGIPKLLVKTSPGDAESLCAKNLGEVNLRKGPTHRSQVAVLHISRAVPSGEVLMSVKLADLLELEEGDVVEVLTTLSATARAVRASQEPASPTAPTASVKEVIGPTASTSPELRLPRQSPSSGRLSARCPETDGLWVPSQTPPQAPKLPFERPDRREVRREDKDTEPRFDFGCLGSRSAARTGLGSPTTLGPRLSEPRLAPPPPPPAPATPEWLLGAAKPERPWSSWSSATSLGPGSLDDLGCGTGLGGRLGRPILTGRSDREGTAAPPHPRRDLRAGLDGVPTRPEGRYAGSLRESLDLLGFSDLDLGIDLGDFSPSAGTGAPSAREPRAHQPRHVPAARRRSDRFFSEVPNAFTSESPWDVEGHESFLSSLHAAQGGLYEEPERILADLFGQATEPPRQRPLRQGYLERPMNAPVSEVPPSRVPAPSKAEDLGRFGFSRGTPAPVQAAEVLRPSHKEFLEQWLESPLGETTASTSRVRGRDRSTRGDAVWHDEPAINSFNNAASESDGRGLHDFHRTNHDLSHEQQGFNSHQHQRNHCPIKIEAKAPLGEAEPRNWRAEAAPGRSTATAGPPPEKVLWPPPRPSQGFPPALSAMPQAPGTTLWSKAASQPQVKEEVSDAIIPPTNCVFGPGLSTREGSSKTSSRAASTSTSPPSSGSTSDLRRDEPFADENEAPSPPIETRPNPSDCEQVRPSTGGREPPQRVLPVTLPLAIVPSGPSTGGNTPGGTTTPGSASRRHSSLLYRRRSTLGSLQPEAPQIVPLPAPRLPVPGHWRPPCDNYCGGLERSELGTEATAEVRRWLLGDSSGLQCSQVVLDRALTVLSNFKLASGCQLEVLGGPLGALVGGYSDADWLYDEVFQKQPGDAIIEAFAFLGFKAKFDGDWSSVAVEEISLVYRRMCLRGHPSRGGSPRDYLKLQVSMELIRAFSGEGEAACELKSTVNGSFVLNDLALVKELQLTQSQADSEATQLTQEQLEELNRALDEYILRQMCFKSEIVDEIARLHEDSAYAILGVSSQATDSEIKKAYRLIAMQCHPDKGGDKEDFQELTNAYEKIMEQRRTDDKGGKNRFGTDEDETTEVVPPTRPKRPTAKAGTDGEKSEGTEEKEAEPGVPGSEKSKGIDLSGAEEDEGGDGSDASLVEKASKAAEEASRYAKTAAEFAHQAAEAAEAARQDQASGNRESFTKSIAHSAIVYTLTVVKAVRAVGYATLDVAAQCRAASKRHGDCRSCADHAVTAMGLGLDALSSALACAEVTETTAAELQAPGEGAAERFVGAAVRASLAAASASNAAMAAAITAIEGSRQCAKALDRRAQGGDANDGEDASDGAPDASEAKRAKAKKAKARAKAHSMDDSVSSDGEAALRRKAPTPEEAAAASAQRLSAQRNNNQKVLQRLNAEILMHQRNVRQVLQSNRQLIPDVTSQAKRKVFHLLADYAAEARIELMQILLPRREADWPRIAAEQLVIAAEQLQLLVPFLQPQNLAIPVSVKARVLKMASLYDLPSATQLLEEELFRSLSCSMVELSVSFEAHRNAIVKASQQLDAIWERVRQKLACNIADEGPA